MRYILCLAFVVLTGCHAINQKFGWQDDNVVEESAETILEASIDHYIPLHLDVDFTPNSPESIVP